MQQTMTRRHLIGTTIAASSAMLVPGFAIAQDTAGTEASGGIGFPQESFESIYGPGTPSGDLLVYPNPYLDGSQLSVVFQDGVAVFIEMSTSDSGDLAPEEAAMLSQNLMPDDAAPVGQWLISSQDTDAIQFQFSEFNAPSMHMAGSGATRMQSCVMTVGPGPTVAGITVSLAIPEGANQFAPAEGSVGVGGTVEAWINVHGEPVDGGAAAGTHYGQYDVPPWDEVLVISHSATGDDIISSIDATSASGVAVEDAIAFGDSILPQGTQLQTAFEAFPTDAGPQGWGTSTWMLPDNGLIILFMLGAADGSGNVVRTASMLSRL